uniref:Uncharacterized protein n=1 Tax=Oryza nivara TaxID=4536 RepID=A0A0E0FXI2_ORYNI
MLETINRRLVQWLLCVCLPTPVALLMPGICISLCHTMQTVLYSEKGSSGDCGDHQMAHLPQLGHVERGDNYL